MKRSRYIQSVLAAAAFAFVMTACGKTPTVEPVEVVSAVAETPAATPEPTETPTPTPAPTDTPTPTPTPTEEPEPELKTIGREAEGENIFKVALRNSTGKAIMGFAVKEMSMEEYPDSLLEGEDVFADGEERILYYDATEALAANEETNSEDMNAPVVTPGYDIQMTFDDGETAELHGFPFGDAEEAEIHMGEEVAYITYTSAMDGGEVSTEEAEISAKQLKEQAEAEEAYEEPVYEEPAPVYQEPAPVYEEPAPVYEEPAPVYEEPAPAAPPAEAPAAGGDDACLTDGLTY